MRGAHLVVVVAITTVVATALGSYRGLVAVDRLRVSMRHTLRMLGFGFAFLVSNVVLLVGSAITLRSLFDVFVSVYIANDLTLLGLSMLQGIFFSHWREQTARPEATCRRA